MAMTPQEQQKMDQLERVVQSLINVENVPFIDNLKRRLDFLSTDSTLSDLSDVSDTDGASTGQVLKKTSTTWQPGTDNTA